MSFSSDDKAYITARMLSADPAHGMSSEHYRALVGVTKSIDPKNITGGSKKQLKKRMKKMIGGLSEEESRKILSTTSYAQLDPQGLVLGNNIVDYSNSNSLLHANASDRAKNHISSTSQGPYIG